MTTQRFLRSFWRVPLVSLIGGLLYSPGYAWLTPILDRLIPGMSDGAISLLSSFLLFISVLIVSWLVLMTGQRRTDVFLSATIVVVYSLAVYAAQVLTGSAADQGIFLTLNKPLEWTAFGTGLGVYFRDYVHREIPHYEWLHCFLPWIATLFVGKPVWLKGKPAPKAAATETAEEEK